MSLSASKIACLVLRAIEDKVIMNITPVTMEPPFLWSSPKTYDITPVSECLALELSLPVLINYVCHG